MGPERTLKLLPGAHYVQAPTGGVVRFRVTDDGKVEIDPTYARWATGAGTPRLTVHAVEITIDATATTHTRVMVSGITVWKDARSEQVVRLLPGDHRLAAFDGGAYDFVIRDDGRVDYAPSLDGVLPDGTPPGSPSASRQDAGLVREVDPRPCVHLLDHDPDR